MLSMRYLVIVIVCFCFFFFFFFSSRRRHTRSYGDWSSDVCSSDLPGVIEVSCLIEALQNLSQNQVTDGQRFEAKQAVESLGLRRDRPLEVIDPHAGVDKGQLSVLIAFRSPCQSSFPRSRRICACLLRRSRVRSASSTASRLVFRPVARSVSRISLSSFPMFVRIDVYSCC